MATATPASIRTPWSSTWTVRAARDAYLRENGFTIEAYDASTTEASFLGVRFRVPNTPRHRWALLRHDLHHVATGFGTDLVGEAEISAWELRDLRTLGLYVGAIVASATLMGLVRAPLRTCRALRASGKTLFADDADLDALLDLTVAELRARLDMPAGGIAEARRHLHAYAPA